MRGEVAARIVRRIADGLNTAHQQGIIHRDLKPANILMRDRCHPVITDFGLAHHCGPSSHDSDECLPIEFGRRSERTTDRDKKILGSPAYMSPEQVRGEVDELGPATDVYGLGAILYELLTGKRPFSGSVPAIYGRVLAQTPLKPSSLVPGLDKRFDSICN